MYIHCVFVVVDIIALLDNERDQRLGTAEAKKWARHKSLHMLLNDINIGDRAISAPGTSDLFLLEWDPLEKVLKSYKRALLKIHPDKHAGSNLREQAKATEMFKVKY